MDRRASERRGSLPRIDFSRRESVTRIDSSTRLINSHHESYKKYCDSGELVSSIRRPGSRRPFHYPVNQGHIQPDPDVGVAATFNRYRYYNRLADPSIDTLSIPDHVIPDDFFHPFLLVPSSLQGKQSSLITIFAMWNTMMGTSLLSIPWALEKSGFASGLLLLIIMGALCAYTAYLIIRMPKISGLTNPALEFSDICSHYLGRWAKWFSLTFSLLPLLGGAVVYWVLMSNFLYHCVLFLYETITGEMSIDPTNNSTLDVFCVISDTSVMNVTSNVTLPNDLFYKLWDLDLTVPIFLALCLGPMISLKSPTFFAKFNALGTVSVGYLCIFALVKASSWGLHIDMIDQSSPDYAPFFESSFPALTGILSMAYFIHNGVLTLCRNQRNPENNARDLFIAFVLVAVTYLFIGSIFFAFFPLPKSCIQDNILNNFHPSDAMAVITRVFLLFQLLTVFPLIIYWTRIQFLLAVFKSAYPSAKHVFVLNSVVLITCILFAIYLPHIGTIIRYCGALAGLAYIFTLPNVLYMKAMWLEGRLSAFMCIVHVFIVFLGVGNFVAQFFV